MSRRAYTQLHFAAQCGDLTAVKEALAKGQSPNHFDEGGCTPLHYAAAECHIEVIQALLAAGADVNAQDEGVAGDNPIGYVAGNCSRQIAQLLLEAGADPTIPGSMQLTALYHAEKRKRGDGPKVYQLLCAAAQKRGKRS